MFTTFGDVNNHEDQTIDDLITIIKKASDLITELNDVDIDDKTKALISMPTLCKCGPNGPSDIPILTHSDADTDTDIIYYKLYDQWHRLEEDAQVEPTINSGLQEEPNYEQAGNPRKPSSADGEWIIGNSNKYKQLFAKKRYDILSANGAKPMHHGFGSQYGFYSDQDNSIADNILHKKCSLSIHNAKKSAKEIIQKILNMEHLNSQLSEEKNKIKQLFATIKENDELIKLISRYKKLVIGITPKVDDLVNCLPIGEQLKKLKNDLGGDNLHKQLYYDALTNHIKAIIVAVTEMIPIMQHEDYKLFYVNPALEEYLNIDALVASVGFLNSHTPWGIYAASHPVYYQELNKAIKSNDFLSGIMGNVFELLAHNKQLDTHASLFLSSEDDATLHENLDGMNNTIQQLKELQNKIGSLQTHNDKSMLAAFTEVASAATASNGNLLDSENFNRWVERYSSQTEEIHKKLDKRAKLDATVTEAQAATSLNPFM